MPETTLATRFDDRTYSAEDCNAAISGKKIPLALGFDVTRMCVVRGIRYHPGFGEELCGLLGVFTRAVNARKIMSNIIPKMREPEEFPYCIWHPDVASESTYRELAKRYPQMVYHVGRACAVAGYTQLHKDLSLLPEVHIAEEARDNSSEEIFEEIVRSGQMYSVMDDYTRTTHIDSPVPDVLNGNTCVRSMLEVKQKHREPETDWLSMDTGYRERYFDITEDLCLDMYNTYNPLHEIYPFPNEFLPLIYSPLPVNLPTVYKDLLILLAAHSGNIDRYTRLRRPKMIQTELNCILRGIYHHPMFAKWWYLQLLCGQDTPYKERITRSIHARFIMSNDLSHITPDTPPGDLPSNIWFPNTASPFIYKELARRQPRMNYQVVRACIVANYQGLYDELSPDVVPDRTLRDEARISQNPHYLQDIERRIRDEGITLGNHCKEMPLTIDDCRRGNSEMLLDGIAEANVSTYFPGPYDGRSANISDIELFLLSSDELKSKFDDGLDLEEYYEGGEA